MLRGGRGSLLWAAAWLGFGFHIADASAKSVQGDIELALKQQFEISTYKLLDNISPKGTLPGTVIAAPSRAEPDYFFHWTRDGSLVMSTFLDLENPALISHVRDFALLSEIHQSHWTPAGLGEPKYLVNGEPFTGDWGRPQNDGPALRAITLIRYARQLIDAGEMDWVTKHLYASGLPAKTVIKKDLEYVSHHWMDTDFDPWEEIRGHHFFNRILQRRALKEGAKLARALNDPAAANWYDLQAKRLGKELERHWDARRGYIVSTVDRDGGIDYKLSGIDTSVILGVLYSQDAQDPFFDIHDDRVLSTAEVILSTFRHLYNLNHVQPSLGVGIGRYPEDRYDGYRTDRSGNPWFLITAAFADFHYALAKKWVDQGAIIVTPENRKFFNSLILSSPTHAQLQYWSYLKAGSIEFKTLVQATLEAGDDYMRRVMFHLDTDGSMSEQFNRDTGFMQGAPNLTWSHAAFLRATKSRGSLIRSLK